MCLLVKITLLACVLVATAKGSVARFDLGHCLLSLGKYTNESREPLTEEETRAMVAELVGKCKSAEGASDADVQEAMAHQSPTTRQGQCFHACMMETFGIMVDRKLSVEGSAKLAEMTGDPAKIKNSAAVTKECVSVGGGDRCDSASAIFDCIAAAAVKLGIDPIKDLS